MRSAIVVLILCLPLSATQYFVTQSGAATCAGATSAGTPMSVATYNACALPTGDDTVTFSGTLTSTVTPNTGGSSGHQLILNFSAATIGGSGTKINDNLHNFITLTGGTISTENSGSSLILCNNSSNVVVQGFSFTGASGGSDAFFETASLGGTAGCNNVTIQNNTLLNIESGVIADGGAISNYTIQNNLFSSSVNVVDQTDLIFLGDAREVVIQGNKIVQQAPGANVARHNDGIQTFRSGSGAAQNPGDWILRYNWIELAVTSGSGDNSWTMLENLADGPNGYSIKEYGNVFVGTGSALPGGNGAVDHFGTNAADHHYAYNNTYYRHAMPLDSINFGSNGSQTADGAGTLFAENNVAGADSTDGLQINWHYTRGLWDFNFFTSNFDSTNCTATITGTHGSCSSSPQFTNTTTNDFSLQAGSALRNAGDATIGSEFNQGPCPSATWPNPTLCLRSVGNWDAGAFQTSSSVTPPSAPAVGLFARGQAKVSGPLSIR